MYDCFCTAACRYECIKENFRDSLVGGRDLAAGTDRALSAELIFFSFFMIKLCGRRMLMSISPGVEYLILCLLCLL